MTGVKQQAAGADALQHLAPLGDRSPRRLHVAGQQVRLAEEDERHPDDDRSALLWP